MRIKNVLKVCALASILSLGGIFAMSQPNIQADAALGESTFKLIEGMSIRTAEPEGLRFTTEISESEKSNYSEDAQFGVLLAPEGKVSGDMEITAAGEVNDQDILVIPTRVWVSEYTEGFDAYYSVIVNKKDADGNYQQFPEALYNTPLVARGYVIDGDTITYTTNTMTRSISYVATCAWLNGTQATGVIGKFVDKQKVEFSVNDGQPLNVSESYDILAEIGGIAMDASSKVSVTFTSDNEAVAKVEGNQLVAVAEGEAKLTVTMSGANEEYTKEITVNVVDNRQEYTVNHITRVKTETVEATTTIVSNGVPEVEPNTYRGYVYSNTVVNGTTINVYYDLVGVKYHAGTESGLISARGASTITEKEVDGKLTATLNRSTSAASGNEMLINASGFTAGNYLVLKVKVAKTHDNPAYTWVQGAEQAWATYIDFPVDINDSSNNDKGWGYIMFAAPTSADGTWFYVNLFDSNWLGDIAVEAVYEMTYGGYKTFFGLESFIVNAGMSDYRIVVSEQANSEVTLASEELVYFLQQSTGVTLPIVTETQVNYSSDARLIILGDTEFTNYAQVEIGNLEPNGYTIKTVGENLFVVGADCYGVLYGVYDLLNELVDYEVYRYDEITVTQKTELKLPNLDFTDSPDFAWREPTYGSVWDVQAANRMRFQRDIWMTQNGNFVHNTFSEYLPPNVYAESHDKWYSNDQEQLCYTAHGNSSELEQMRATVLNRMKEIITYYFEKGDYRSLISFTQEDTQSWCTCMSCTLKKYQYGTDAAAVIQFINPVAEELQTWLEATYPGHPVYITIFAYYSTEDAPVKKVNGSYQAIDDTVVPADNIMVLYAPIYADYFRSLNDSSNAETKATIDKWSSITSNMGFWLYTTNFADYMAWFDSFGAMQENYQLLKEYGAIYFFDQGRYNAGSLTAFDNLKVYLNSKLMWNVNADITQLTQNFFDNFFKDASQPMMEYYQSYRDRSNYIIETMGVEGYIYGEITAEQYPMALLESWLQKIDEAYAAIEYLKSVDKDLYDTLEARITQESMAIRFRLIQLYATSYNSETLMDMKLSFKEDAARLGFIYNTEWSTFEDATYPEWNVKTVAKYILRDQDEEIVADIVGSALADFVPGIKEYDGYSYTEMVVDGSTIYVYYDKLVERTYTINHITRAKAETIVATSTQTATKVPEVAPNSYDGFAYTGVVVDGTTINVYYDLVGVRYMAATETGLITARGEGSVEGKEVDGKATVTYNRGVTAASGNELMINAAGFTAGNYLVLKVKVAKTHENPAYTWIQGEEQAWATYIDFAVGMDDSSNNEKGWGYIVFAAPTSADGAWFYVNLFDWNWVGDIAVEAVYEMTADGYMSFFSAEYTINHILRTREGLVTQEVDTIQSIGAPVVEANSYDGYTYTATVVNGTTINVYYDLVGVKYMAATTEGLLSVQGAGTLAATTKDGIAVINYARPTNVSQGNELLINANGYTEGNWIVIYAYVAKTQDNPAYTWIQGEGQAWAAYMDFAVGIDDASNNEKGWGYIAFQAPQAVDGKFVLNLFNYNYLSVDIAAVYEMTAEGYNAFFSTEYTINHILRAKEGFVTKDVETVQSVGMPEVEANSYDGYAYAVMIVNGTTINVYYDVTGVEYHAAAEAGLITVRGEATITTKTIDGKETIAYNRGTNVASGNELMINVAGFEAGNYLVLKVKVAKTNDNPAYTWIQGEGQAWATYLEFPVDINDNSNNDKGWGYIMFAAPTSADGAWFYVTLFDANWVGDIAVEAVYEMTAAGYDAFFSTEYTINHILRTKEGLVTEDVDTIRSAGLPEIVNTYEGYEYSKTVVDGTTLNVYYEMVGVKYTAATEAGLITVRGGGAIETKTIDGKETVTYNRGTNVASGNELMINAAGFTEGNYLVLKVRVANTNDNPAYTWVEGAGRAWATYIEFSVDVNDNSTTDRGWGYIMFAAPTSADGTWFYVNLFDGNWVGDIAVEAVYEMTAEAYNTFFSAKYTVNYILNTKEGLVTQDVETINSIGLPAVTKTYQGYAVSTTVVDGTTLNVYYEMVGVEYHAATETGLVSARGASTITEKEVDGKLTATLNRGTNTASGNELMINAAGFEAGNYLVLKVKVAKTHDSAAYTWVQGEGQAWATYLEFPVDINDSSNNDKGWGYIMFAAPTSLDGWFFINLFDGNWLGDIAVEAVYEMTAEGYNTFFAS